MHSRKRWLAICTSLAMMIGLLTAVAAPPALAEEPDDVESLQPDASYFDGIKTVLADQDDGVDELAHLTALGSADVEVFAWYNCGDEFDNLADDFEDECEFLGEDEATAPDVEDTDDLPVFGELFWDVDDDAIDQMFIVLGCEGTDSPDDRDIDNTSDLPEDCLAHFVDGVQLDDSDEFATGEITGVCPSSTANECDQDTEFDDNGHGSTLPDTEDGWTIEFWTSDDVNVDGDPFVCLEDLDSDDTDVNSATACDVEADANLDTDESDDNDGDPDRWTASFTSGQLAGFEDGDTVDVGIGCDPFASGQDDCETDDDYQIIDTNGPDEPTGEDDDRLILDEHAKVVGDEAFGGEAGDVCLSFEPLTTNETDTPDDDDHPDDANDDTEDGEPGCETDEDVVEDENNTMSDDEELIEGVDLEGAIFDEQDDLVEGEEATAEITEDFGELHACEDACVLHDHNDDGLDEHAHWEADDDGDGLYEFSISNRNADDPANGEAGSANATFCLDEEATGNNAGTEAAPGADHGCEDEDAARKAAARKGFGGEPEEIVMEFSDGTPAFADCLDDVDMSVKDNEVGDDDTIIICTMSADDTPASTADDDEGRIEVRSSNPSVVSVTGAPTETPSAGFVTGTVHANAQGSATIEARLFCDEDEGDCPTDDVEDTDTIVKNVRPRGGDPQCSDGVDNDGDGAIDFPNDNGCTSAQDNSESDIQDERIPTNLTIRYNRASKRFKGSVGSGHENCQNQRLVKLFKKRKRRQPKVIGRDFSNNNGNWAIPKPRPKGRYFARVRNKVFQHGDHATNCLFDQSPTIKVRRRRR